MTQAVFRSTMQAIHVSYMLASLPATQKGNTQSIIEWMRDRAGKPEIAIPSELRSVNFHGLTREQVRGQCAMVRASVERLCLAPEIHALRGMFASDHTKAEAVRYMADYLQDHGLESRELKMHLLWWVNMTEQQRREAGLTLRAIEGRYAKDHVTLSRVAGRLSKVLSSLRNQGAKRVNGHFVASGLVCSDEESLDAPETTHP